MFAKQARLTPSAELALCLIAVWAAADPMVQPAGLPAVQPVAQPASEPAAGADAAAAGPSGARSAALDALEKDPQLLGWWRFDETTGTAAADASGHGRQGTLEGGLSFAAATVPGVAGKALQFDGDDDRVLIAGFKGVLGKEPRSISLWIKTDSPRGELVSWGKRDIGQMWNMCFVRGRVGVTPHGGYYYMAEPVHDQKWHHVVAVLSGGEEPTLEHNAVLYLDGKIAEIDRIGLLSLWTIDTGADQEVTIGRGFKGAIDDVCIYGRVLSGDEVEALYQRGR